MRRIAERRTKDCSYCYEDWLGNERISRISVLYADGDFSKPVVYASDWSVNFDATAFLREGYLTETVNTKLQAASAIKLLYSYLELFGVSFEEMTKQQAKGLVEFMRGTLGSGASYSVELWRTRSESTLSYYLSVARKFARHLELDSHPLLRKKSRSGLKRAGLPNRSEEAYDIDVKTVSELEAPKHVSTEQYVQLLEVQQILGNQRNRVIVRLMREHGLRIGEVLGLTIEDVGSYIDDNMMPRYCLELRNRLSDAPHQCAKTAMKVRTEASYRLPEYATVNAGFEVVTLGYDLAEELIAYIDAAHSGAASEKFEERRRASAAADRVTSRLDDGTGNFYVFLNSLGRPLTQKRWSQILREAYGEAGIPVDRCRKEKNLSHRLRHGFAMYLKHERHCDEYEVMILMRHSSLESQKAYDNPAPEDILRLQERIIDGRQA